MSIHAPPDAVKSKLNALTAFYLFYFFKLTLRARQMGESSVTLAGSVLLLRNGGVAVMIQPF